MKAWYEQLFTNYANTYDKEPFTEGTIQEVDFIEEEIRHNKLLNILDIGCGTGRHAIELAKRGYKVTGIDLSKSQLQRAREKAEQAGVDVQFLQKDARDFYFKNPFDLIIMLCEGAFPLMETDEMNFRILKNAECALKGGGKFIFTTLNALFPLFHSVKDFINKHDNSVKSKENSFDLITFRDHSKITVIDDLGKKKNLICNERYYAPPEIVWLLKSLRFKKVEIFGCNTGEFSRSKQLTAEDFEMLLIAEK